MQASPKTFAQLETFLAKDITQMFGASLGGLGVNGLFRHASYCTENSVFIALPGQRVHANSFAAQAVQAGARLMITDQCPAAIPESLVVWLVPALAERLATLANWFYDHPSRELCLIGITGTNGKTTTSFLTAQALHKLGHRVALMGTLGAGVYPDLVSTGHTTPDILTIQAWLYAAQQQGCKYAVMEVSSHAVVQGRIDGLAFAVKAMTQVTEDHLDFHGSLQAYHQAKMDFFLRSLPGQSGYWVINQQDSVGQQLLKAIASYPSEAMPLLAGYYPRESAPAFAGPNPNSLSLVKHKALAKGYQLDLAWQKKRFQLNSSLLGEYNIENLLCSLRILLAVGFNLADLVALAETLHAPSGRLEQVSCVKPLQVVVDFAHTTDALRQVLLTLNKQRSAIDKTAALWVVFGCGGDRDKTKRPAMTSVAYQLADHLVLTSDNPRSEQIDMIFNDMLAGLPSGYDQLKIMIQPDRQLAIEAALAGAKEGDWVLIAGKGHETTQEINGIYFAFSDQQVIKDWTP
ncbi:UDP-N-acetylmuramyl peptide synthase [Thiomicrospira aerophila AL3]|uniref:UDP-N-acetylmuramoyl-L-alanyl-D-glutamate--2,6-diaminopimelate ligase n=2 Tax=Thiomicrospira aerophila TaxID=92245 RepID=W0DT65_9GAMM|nr:UDP-N-acetylmuramyl peptide synthase [Thiomicrospira aerophila AL3]